MTLVLPEIIHAVLYQRIPDYNEQCGKINENGFSKACRGFKYHCGKQVEYQDEKNANYNELHGNNRHAATNGGNGHPKEVQQDEECGRMIPHVRINE